MLAPGSLALYSLATPEEQARLANRLREAYLALAGAGTETPATAGQPQPAANPPQPSPLARPHTGESLRETRLARGLSLDDVARRIRVRPQQLAWIEEGTFEQLPARVFTRGFVMADASFRDLDAEEVWADVAARWDATSPPTPEEPTR